MQNDIRNVIIGTPCLDGRVDALYTHSLIESIKTCANIGINLHPVFITRESLLQRARNDLMYYAHISDISDMVFIDSDQFWKSEDLIKLLNNDKDFIGGTYRKKSYDTEQYVVKVLNEDVKIDENGLMEVAGLGTGFLKLSKKAIDTFFESSDISEYAADDGEKRKMIFNISISEQGDLVGEDIYMCNLYRQLGGHIHLDTNITIGHVGSIIFNGNFKKWFTKTI